MENIINMERFNTLLSSVHENENALYVLYDNNNQCVEAVYETDYESDNGLEEGEEGYEEYQCIVFKQISDGSLFEVNYHEIPVKVICDGVTVY